VNGVDSEENAKIDAENKAEAKKLKDKMAPQPEELKK
jgi:hypothetical protein